MPATWAWSSAGPRRGPPCPRSSTSSAGAAIRSPPTPCGRPDMPVVELGPDRCDALLAFFGSLPDGDLTFIKEEVTDPDTVRGWATDSSPGGRWVATDGNEVTGYVAVRPLSGWSDHVGEVRLVVSPARRGTALGRELARRAGVEGGSFGLP